jgi:hypothetical protein
MIDFISSVGGQYSSYTLIFITIPASLFISSQFLNFISDHLWKKEKKRHARKHGKVGNDVLSGE